MSTCSVVYTLDGSKYMYEVAHCLTSFVLAGKNAAFLRVVRCRPFADEVRKPESCRDEISKTWY